MVLPICIYESEQKLLELSTENQVGSIQQGNLHLPYLIIDDSDTVEQLKKQFSICQSIFKKTTVIPLQARQVSERFLVEILEKHEVKIRKKLKQTQDQCEWTVMIDIAALTRSEKKITGDTEAKNYLKKKQIQYGHEIAAETTANKFQETLLNLGKTGFKVTSEWLKIYLKTNRDISKHELINCLNPLNIPFKLIGPMPIYYHNSDLKFL